MADIIDENNFLEGFAAIIKFGSKKNLESFQSGKLYMKNLKYYNDLEENQGVVGVGDKFDGKFVLTKMQIKLTDKSTDKKVSFDAEQVVFDFKYGRNPVFCTFLIDKRNIIIDNPVIQNNLVNFRIIFNDEQKNKIGSNFGDSALIITDIGEFLKRITTSLNGLKINYKMGEIKYYDKSINQLERYQDIMKDTSQCAFWKIKSLFEYQQEFRIMCLNKEVDDHFEIDIGNLEDITILVPIKDIIDQEHELRCYGYYK